MSPILSGTSGTAADFLANSTAETLGVGPFTHAQLIELLLRVKKIHMVGSIVHSGGTRTVDEILIRKREPGADPEEATSESHVFQALFGQGGLAEWDYDAGVGTDSVSVYIASIFQYPETLGKDENGKFWCLNASVGGRLWSDGAGISSYDATGNEITANLLLASGTVPLTVGVEAPDGESVTSATCSFTVTEWYPYATSTGAAAWDTATGLAANGGPAA